MRLSYQGPVSCVFTSWVSSGLTVGSGCSLMAAGWQVCVPSWVSSGLTSSCWRTAFTDDCDILCFQIWQAIFRLSTPHLHLFISTANSHSGAIAVPGVGPHWSGQGRPGLWKSIPGISGAVFRKKLGRDCLELSNPFNKKTCCSNIVFICLHTIK